jgi:hypothetical protein
MEKYIINLTVFVLICFVSYLLFRSININYIEGMTSDSLTNSITSTTSSGVAGNAQSYAANIKSLTVKNQDTLLISKYRNDYENVILNLDDYVNTLMLQTALNIDPVKSSESLDKLRALNETKSALNNVMKYIDKSH